MRDSHANNSPSSHQWKLSRLLLTVGLVALLVLHVAGIITLDLNALAVLGLIFLLWIPPVIEELQISEYFRVKVKTAERTLAISELEAAARLGQQQLRFLLPDWEFALLQRIASEAPFVTDTPADNEPFYAGLHHLLERGFIERIHVHTRIPPNSANQNVHDFYRVTALGSEYIQLRSTPDHGVGDQER